MKTAHGGIPAALGAFITLLALTACAQAPLAGTPPDPASLGSPAARTVNRTAANRAPVQSCPFCDLRNAKMANMDLTDANLQGANLQGADMTGANLSGAILARANLSGANLSGARLGRSAKGRADLSRANLTNATLTGATFDATDLQYSNLTGITGIDFGSSIIRPAIVPPAANDPIACGNANLSNLQSRIYVSTTGTDGSGCGTSVSTSCATISQGISRCAGANACGVLVLWGEFKPATPIAMADGINVYGGCTTQMPGTAALQSLIDAPAGGQPAVSASNIAQGAILQGFKLAGTPGPTASVTLMATNSAKLSVIDTTVFAGSGGNAVGGSTGGAGAAGVSASGATAGTQPTCGPANGGNGSVAMSVYLSGNETSFTCHPTCSANNCWGYWSASRAAGGEWGNGNCVWCPQSRGDSGNGGAAGGDATTCGGKGSASGNAAGTFSGGVWRPSVGSGAGSGMWGTGGGGGGSGGYKAGYCFGQRTWDGNQGGGGGSGGCGGGGGGTAAQGGAAFAAVLINTTLAITNSSIVGAVGGAGGPGGAGGQGGARSFGAGGSCEHGGGCGGSGGNGGAGASGGGGAGGNGGPAVGIALVGSKLTGTGTVYYTGTSGPVGGSGAGGQPIVAGLCAGGNGDAGIAGAAVDTQAY